jgi:hypothetical protein
MSDLTVSDDWEVMGASGTGSNSVTCGELFIPEHRVALVPADLHGVLRADTAAGTNCALALGIAQHGLQAFLELARTRGITHLGYESMGDAPIVQAAVARAAADIKLIECYRQWVLSPFTGGPKIGAQDASVASIASVRCLEMTRGIIEGLLDLAPSTDVHRTQPLQRLLRDIHVFQHQHAMTPFISYELFGRRLFDIALFGKHRRREVVHFSVSSQALPPSSPTAWSSWKSCIRLSTFLPLKVERSTRIAVTRAISRQAKPEFGSGHWSEGLPACAIGPCGVDYRLHYVE